jgi:hypothetical protein
MENMMEKAKIELERFPFLLNGKVSIDGNAKFQKKCVAEWVHDYDFDYDHDDSLQEAIDLGFQHWYASGDLMKTVRSFARKVREIAHSTKFDQFDTYVWFNENMPFLGGKVFSDFRIADVETDEVLYVVVPRTSGLFGKSEVWGKENGFSAPLVSGSWKDVVDFFGYDYSVEKVNRAGYGWKTTPVEGKPVAKVIGKNSNVRNVVKTCVKALEDAGKNSDELMEEVNAVWTFFPGAVRNERIINELQRYVTFA